MLLFATFENDVFHREYIEYEPTITKGSAGPYVYPASRCMNGAHLRRIANKHLPKQSSAIINISDKINNWPVYALLYIATLYMSCFYVSSANYAPNCIAPSNV